MRTNLWNDPRVSSLCDLTGAGEATVIGALYWLWASADEHTEDGRMPGLTLAGIDRKTGVKGIAQALAGIGWIAEEEGGITILGFEEHNGASAKRRSLDAQRKATVRKVSASQADTSQTDDGRNAAYRGARVRERVREEKNTSSLRSEDARKRAPPTRPDGVEQQTWDDWTALRARKRAAVSQTVVTEAAKEAEKAGLTLDRFLAIWCLRGSQGMQADWIKPEERAPPRASPEPEWRAEQRRRIQQAVPNIADRPAAEFFDVEAKRVATDRVD